MSEMTPTRDRFPVETAGVRARSVEKRTDWEGIIPPLSFATIDFIGYCAGNIRRALDPAEIIKRVCDRWNESHDRCDENTFDELLKLMRQEVIASTIQAAFAEENWQVWGPKLRKFTDGLLRARQWPLGRPQADDVINTVYEKLRNEKRTWRPEKASLYACLCGMIRSEISNALRRTDSKTNVDQTPETADTRDFFEEELLELRAELADATELDRQIAEIYMQHGPVPPRKVAEQLEVDVKTVYSANTRLRRRFRSWAKKQEEAE